MRVIVGKTYQHYKGHKYKVLEIAREEDLGVDFVIHRGLHDGRVWARSMHNFTSLKEDFTARFKELDE